jgi:hypothetical protein
MIPEVLQELVFVHHSVNTRDVLLAARGSGVTRFPSSGLATSYRLHSYTVEPMFRHNALPPSSGSRINQSDSKKASMNLVSHSAWYMRLNGCLVDLLSVQKMKTVRSSETSVNFYHTTWHQILEGVTLLASQENPKFKTIISAQFLFRCCIFISMCSLICSLYFSLFFPEAFY